MKLASINENPDRKLASIRDTSATDRIISGTGTKRRRLWISLSALLVLAIITGAVYPLLSKWSQAEISVPLSKVRLAEVSRGRFVRDVGVQGSIIAAVSPTLFSPADGTVTLRIQAGDSAENGDILATVDSPELTNELLQEESTLQRLATELKRQAIEFKSQQLANQQTIDLAQVKISAAERELRRADASYKANVISERDYEKAVDDVETARLEYRHAQESAGLEKERMEFELQAKKLERGRQQLLVDNLTRRVDELSIRSPVSGIIGNLLIDQKAAVDRNQPLLTVVDLSAFEIEVQIPESYADDLAIGMEAEVTYSGRSYPGLLTAVSPEVRNNQVTGRVRFADIPPAGLRQNQRVSVKIVLEERDDVLLVLRGPFYDSGNGRLAYLVAEGLARRQAISIGSTSVNALEISAGLKEGDMIVISDITRFKGAQTVYLTD
jgi:HlyD family secretion protein